MARQCYGSLSVFFGWLLAEDLVETNPMDRVKAPKVEQKPVPTVEERIFQRYLDTCDGSFKGGRDFSLLWLLWDSGMRLGEIAGIRLHDIDRQTEQTASTARALNRYTRCSGTTTRTPRRKCFGSAREGL